MARNTRMKIVEKAEKLLWNRGYEGTSLNEVVAKAGVSKGAFFHYYPNKQAISQDVINKYASEQLIEPLKKHLEDTHSVKNGLFNWVSEFYQAYKANGFKGGCLLGNLALEMSDQNDAARELIKGHFLEMENIITSALRPVMDEGKLFIEPRQLARLVLASLQGVIMSSKVHKDSNRAGREFQALAQMIEYLIKD